MKSLASIIDSPLIGVGIALAVCVAALLMMARVGVN